MNGQMMQQPLLITSLLTHAERHHGEQQIVSRRVEGDIHRRIAKWWTPDDVLFVHAIPLGATGKMLKNRLREMFAEHRLPGA
ncbi:MAG TPA: hypothetical protein VGJ35_10540 [Burkholderiaceae bacterium]|jgi:acyl-CoA synthetase (AMP-forming)/AMP-acid ligase II